MASYPETVLCQGHFLLLTQLKNKFWIHKTYCTLQSDSFSKEAQQMNPEHIKVTYGISEGGIQIPVLEKKKSTKELAIQ